MMADKITFKDVFRFTKDGKMKSGTVVYSFSFAVLYLIIYGAAYYFLIDILASLTKDLPVIAANLIGAVVPAAAGALICAVPLIPEGARRNGLLGYLWIAVFGFVFFVAMCVLLRDDRDALRIFLSLFASMFPAPMVLGGGSAWLLYTKQKQI